MRSKFELPQNSTLKMSVWLHPNLLLIFIPKKPQPVTQQEPNILGLREPSSFRFSSSLNSLLKLLGVSWWCFFFFPGFAVLVAIFQYSCSKSSARRPLSLLSGGNVRRSRPPRRAHRGVGLAGLLKSQRVPPSTLGSTFLLDFEFKFWLSIISKDALCLGG